MTEPIENLYFNWLCAKVLETRINNYHDLMRILHKTEFMWVVQEDKHRAQDGVALRTDFLRETQIPREHIWMTQPCSVLEMLVAFSGRASFNTDIPLKTWFWEFMTNLRLDDFRQVQNGDEYEIDEILYTFVWRQYEPSGYGGIFPMSHADVDQRKIEIWYQFSAYLDDRGLF